MGLAATSIAVFWANRDVERLKLQVDTLQKTTEHFPIDNPTQFHFKRLPQPAPMVFQYQIAIPKDTIMELTMYTGNVSGGKPTIIQRLDISGPKAGFSIPEQSKLTVYLRRKSNGVEFGVNSMGSGTVVGPVPCDLNWYADIAGDSYSNNPPPGFVSPTQSSDVGDTVGLYYWSEDTDTPFRQIVETENPRYFAISIGPSKSNGNAKPTLTFESPNSNSNGTTEDVTPPDG